MPSHLPCSTTFVSPPTIEHACALRRRGHRLDFRAQRLARQARFEDEARHQRVRARAGDRQVVERSVDGEFADRSAVEPQGANDVAVGRRRHARAAERQHGGIRERGERRVREGRRDQPSTRRREAFRPRRAPSRCARR
jgi:hypothetical protein